MSSLLVLSTRNNIISTSIVSSPPPFKRGGWPFFAKYILGGHQIFFGWAPGKGGVPLFSGGGGFKPRVKLFCIFTLSFHLFIQKIYVNSPSSPSATLISIHALCRIFLSLKLMLDISHKH